MLIKFLNEESIRQCTVKKISSHVIELRGVEQNLSGFNVVKENGAVYGKYEDYTTLYREIQGGFLLSNDGSVYVEPEPVPEPEPYEPTLKEVQEQKVAEMNGIQQQVVASGCEVQLADGTKERFTLTTNDQLSLNSLSVKALEGMSIIPWHPADESVHCKFYSEADMKTITDTCMNWVAYHVTYFRDLRIYIRSLTDKETIKAIQYGDDIPFEYQSEVLQSMLAERMIV